MWVNTTSGVSGSQFPTGTPGRPVNNAADAIGIVTSRGLPNRVHLFGTIAIPASLSLVGAIDVKGDSRHTAKVSFGVGGSPPASIVDVTDNNFHEVTILGGYVTGEATYRQCSFKTVVKGFAGDAYNCGLDGTLILDPLAREAKFIDCYSTVAGTGTPVLDCNDLADLDISIRGYNGGILIKNFTDPTGAMTIDLNSGHAKLDSTCTEGTIVVRGVGHITDNSSENCTTVRIGLVEARVLDRTLYVNTAATQNGNGFIQTPFDNITDAIAATDPQDVFTIYVDGDITITSEDISGILFTGPTLIGSTITLGAGATSNNTTQFNSSDVQGTINGPGIYEKCLLRNITASRFIADSCLLTGTLSLVAAGSPLVSNDSQIINSRDAGLGGTPTFDFGTTTHTLNMRAYAGDVTLTNMTAGDTANISIIAGTITIDASCTGGTVRADGTGQLVDNSGSVTINEDNLIYQAGGRSFGGM